MADINARTRHLIGTAADWAAHDLVIGDGEIAAERSGDVVKIKVGNGTVAWSALPFLGGGADGEFLPLTGGILSGPGNLQIEGRLNAVGPVAIGTDLVPSAKLAIGAGDVLGEIGRLAFDVAGNQKAFIGAVRHTSAGQLTDLFAGTMGVERLRVTSDGNVGIWTTAPLAPLHVLGAQSLNAGRNLKTQIGGAASWPADSFEELGIGFCGIRSTFTGGDDWALSFTAGTSAAYGAGTQPERMRITAAGAIQDGAGLELGYRDVPRVTGFERGKCFAATGNVTAPAGAAGETYSIYNDSAAAITITGAGLRLAGTTTVGNRTLAPRGLATIWFNAPGEGIVSGAGVT